MTGQDWFEKDFYATLGVPKNADAAAIKKAYRKLARTLHPDHNPDDAAAESRFKDVGEAYAVLSDPEQRQQYDAIRAMAGGGARFSAPGRGGGSSPAGFEDLFGGLFGAGSQAGSDARVRYSGQQGGGPGLEDLLGGLFGGAAGGGPPGFRPNAVPQTGADLQAATTLPFRQAVEGSTVSVQVEGRRLTARIPPGVRDGQKIRLRGKGRPGELGGPPGDLVIAVAVEPHPVFTLDGRDLRVTVPVTFAEAALGADVDVPTLDGGTVRVKVAEGTPSGRTLRVRGRGVRTPQGDGDLLVTVQVAVPQRLSEDARSAVKAFAEATSDADVRADLMARARS